MNRQGKLPPAAMETVYRSLGRRSSKVVVGPARGFDNAVISVGGRRRMILTTDPVSIIPAVGIEESAWLSVHLIASDYATSGLRPQFATFSFNLPPGLAEAEAKKYLTAVGKECRRLGVTIVAGHTGSYPGGEFTVVGSGTMFGFCDEGEYVVPSMAQPGDSVVMTKGAAIEATASLAISFPRFTEKAVGRRLALRARRLLRECTVVKDASVAASLGLGRDGVTSMHDATEGGVLGGLEEMAVASRRAFVVQKDRIHVTPECEAVCVAHGVDPLTALSEGTLLITCNPGVEAELVKAMARNDINAHPIGRVEKGKGVLTEAGSGLLQRVRQSNDGYWRAYLKGVRAGLH